MLVSLLAFNELHAARPQMPAAVFVTEVQQMMVEDRIEALGTLRANESVELTSSVTEKVTALHFDDADRVEAGQILLEMTNEEEHALLEEARATVAEAKRQYLRIRSLREKQSAAESLLDQRKREWETGRARLAAIESRLADRLIRAPFSGVVGLRNVSIGALVEPGDIITTLDDDSVMKLDFSVPAVYVSVLTPGLTVTATTRAWEGRRFEGEVKSLGSRVDPVTRTIVVRAILPNPDHALRPGMLMQVELLSSRRKAIVIPEECLVPHGDRQFVMVVDDNNRVERREVGIGTRLPGKVEITSGLAISERVITDGTLKARHGSEVTIRALDDGKTPIHKLLEPRSTDSGAP
jgi:membrane fusion protein (multidrug efflux system)